MSKSKAVTPVVQAKSTEEEIKSLLVSARKQIDSKDYKNANSTILKIKKELLLNNGLSPETRNTLDTEAKNVSSIFDLHQKRFTEFKESLNEIWNNPIEYLRTLIESKEIINERIKKHVSEDKLNTSSFISDKISAVEKQVLELIKSPSTTTEQVIKLAIGLISLDESNKNIKEALGGDYPKFLTEKAHKLGIQNPVAQTAYNEAIKLILDKIAITNRKVEKAKLYTDIALIHFANGKDSEGVSQCGEAIKFDPIVYQQFTDSKLLLNLAKSYPTTDLYKSFIVNALSKALTYDVKIYSLIENDTQLQGYIAEIDLTSCFAGYEALDKNNYDNFISWGNILKASGASKEKIDILETSIKAYKKAIECAVSNNDKATASLNIGLTYEAVYKYYESQEKKGDSLYPQATVKKMDASVSINKACKEAITQNSDIYLNIDNKDVLYILSQVYFEKSLENANFELKSIEVLNKLISSYPDILPYVLVYDDSILNQKFVSQIDLKYCFTKYAENSKPTSENFILFAKEFENIGDNNLAMAAYKMAYPLANELGKLDISDKLTQLGISGALANKLDNIAQSSKPKEDTTASNTEALMKVLLTQNAEKEIAKITKECTSKTDLLETKRSSDLASAKTEYNQNVASYLKSIDGNLANLQTTYDLKIQQEKDSLNSKKQAAHLQSLKEAKGNNDAYLSIAKKAYILLDLQSQAEQNRLNNELKVKKDENTQPKGQKLQEMQTNYDSKVQAINETYNTQIAKANEQADRDIAQVNEALTTHISGKEEDNSADIPPPYDYDVNAIGEQAAESTDHS